MAASSQAKKRIRQNETRRLRNKSVKSEIRTLTKRILGYIENNEKDAAAELFPALVSKMDKAAQRRVYHPNTIARKKSQVARSLAKLGG